MDYGNKVIIAGLNCKLPKEAILEKQISICGLTIFMVYWEKPKEK